MIKRGIVSTINNASPQETDHLKEVEGVEENKDEGGTRCRTPGTLLANLTPIEGLV